MPHPRQTIREAVVAALTGTAPDYATAAGARVYETRVIPLQKVNLPALAVYTLRDTVDPASRNTSARELRRTLEVVVEGFVKMAADVDDEIDDLSLEIERAMHADETFGGACGESLLSDTEIDVLETGNQLVGWVKLTYSVTYYTDAPEALDTPLDDLETVNVKWTKLDGETAIHADNQAEDQLEGLEE